jgi:hypothetical protein
MPTTPSPMTVLALASFTLTACGGDDDPRRGDARFAAMTQEQRAQAIADAAGGAIVLPYFLVFFADLDSLGESGCPARDDAGAVVTFTASRCTADNGGTYDGRLVARNVPMFSDLFGDDGRIDPAKPMQIEMDGWRSPFGVFDGTLAQSTPAPADGQRYTTEVSYTISDSPDAGVLQMSADCDDACTLDGWLDRDVLGSYGVTGTIRYGDTIAGRLELRGADTLVVDLDAAVDGCAPVTIDGAAAGEWCFGEPEPEPEPEPAAIVQTSFGCSVSDRGVEIQLDAWVRGHVQVVTATIVETGDVRPFDLVQYDAAADADHYAVVITDAAATRCDALTYKITAYGFEDESRACTAFGANAEALAGECEV